MPYLVSGFGCYICKKVHKTEELAKLCEAQGNPGQIWKDGTILTIGRTQIEILGSTTINVFGFHVRYYNVKTHNEEIEISEAVLERLLTEDH